MSLLEDIGLEQLTQSIESRASRVTDHFIASTQIHARDNLLIADDSIERTSQPRLERTAQRVEQPLRVLVHPIRKAGSFRIATGR